MMMMMVIMGGKQQCLWDVEEKFIYFLQSFIGIGENDGGCIV